MQTIEALQQANRELRGKIEQLQESLRQTTQARIKDEIIFPLSWRLTRSDRVLLSCFINSRREYLTLDMIYEDLYGLRPEEKQPEPKTISVLLCHLRKRLPEGVAIKTMYGVGYTMSKSSRKIVVDACRQAAATVNTFFEDSPGVSRQHDEATGIRELRLRCGLSLKQVSALAGVTVVAAQEAEAGIGSLIIMRRCREAIVKHASA